MQKIIIDKPYKFVPPYRSTFWARIIRDLGLQAIWLRKKHGVVGYEMRHIERLRASIKAGHGVLITPNHSRTCDPIVIGWVARETPCFVYAMASWHLFNQDKFSAWAIHKMGGFSVNREGIDRQAISTAVDVLAEAQRPLVIFPEGTTTRTNDRLNVLLDGVSFVARSAAKKRAKEVAGGKVVVHPVALKYRFGGDLAASVGPVLEEIETRLSWNSQRERSLLNRVMKLGKALLTLKEVEYFDEPQSGSFGERQAQLIERLLLPLETEWLGKAQEGGVVPRIKALRMKLMPEMISGQITPQERERRMRQFADLYLAQQVSCYPEDYLAERPSADRILETVERFEEDLTDKARTHPPLKVIIEIGEPIEVDTQRDRKSKTDPLMTQIEQTLQSMLDRLALESPLWEG